MKLVSITKFCSRKITDGNYGSMETSTGITLEDEILDDDPEKKTKIVALSDKAFALAKNLTDKDLKTYVTEKEDGKRL